MSDTKYIDITDQAIVALSKQLLDRIDFRNEKTGKPDWHLEAIRFHSERFSNDIQATSKMKELIRQSQEMETQEP